MSEKHGTVLTERGMRMGPAKTPTASGRAVLASARIQELDVPPRHLVVQTLRSHDEPNTTIYGLSDRDRGVEGRRRVVFINPTEIVDLGFTSGDLVDLVTHWEGDDTERRVRSFRLVPYETPRGSAAVYYPEINPLVPLDSTATGSNSPTSKSVMVTMQRSKWVDSDGGADA